jgi:hypothetical protein
MRAPIGIEADRRIDEAYLSQQRPRLLVEIKLYRVLSALDPRLNESKEIASSVPP